jgi:class 3 adenylate cyclase
VHAAEHVELWDAHSVDFFDDENVAVMDDPSGGYVFSQVPDLMASASPASLAFRDCASVCWYREVLRNTSKDAIEAEPIFAPDEVSFDTWVVRSDRSVQQLTRGGDEAEPTQRDGRTHPSFMLQGGEEVTLYQRLKKEQKFALAKPHPLINPLVGNFESELPGFIVRGLLVGALLGLAIYNLLVAISTRDLSYRWYCAYLLMMATSFACTSGPVFLSLFFSSEHRVFGRMVGHTADMAMWLCLIMFARTFLNTSVRFGKWDRLMLLPAIPLVTGYCLGYFGTELWAPVSYTGFASAAIPGLVVSFLAYRSGFKPAIFVLCGQLVLAFGAILQTAGDWNLIDITVSSRHSFLFLLVNEPLWFCSLAEAAIFSLALADRMKLLQEEINLRTIQNLRDREVLINEQRVELERQVTVRTSDLVEEKRRADDLLQNILPEEVAAELMASGTTRPKRYDNASVLFTDFRGFTTVVSSLPADRLVQELNDIFRSFDDILDQVGVEKIKTIGDSYMIVAGVPVDCEDHATRCAEAALRMLEFIEERNKTASIKWEMRAGIHSGSVVAGIVGKRKFAYDIFGDTVNIASRMESAGLPGRLNVSAYTYDLIRHQFASEYRGKVPAKGKGDVDMYFISRLSKLEEAKSLANKM